MARSKSFGTFGLIAVLLGVLILVPFFLRQSRIFEGFREKCGAAWCSDSEFCTTVGGGNLRHGWKPERTVCLQKKSKNEHCYSNTACKSNVCKKNKCQ